MRVSAAQAVGEHLLGACIAVVTFLTIVLGLVVGAVTGDLRRYVHVRRL